MADRNQAMSADFSNQVLASFLKYGASEPEKMARLTSELGVDEKWLHDEKQWHSIELQEKFLDLFRASFGDDAIFRAGIQMYEKDGFKLGDSALGLLVSPNLLFSQLPKMVKRMNVYNTYEYRRLKSGLISDSCLVTQNYRDKNKTHYNKMLCDMGRGSIEGSLKKLDYKILNFQEPKCVKNGDDCCEFEITWVRRARMSRAVVLVAPLIAASYAMAKGLFPEWPSTLLPTIFGFSLALPIVFLWRYLRNGKKMQEAFDFQASTLNHLREMLLKERQLSQSLVEYQAQFQKTVNLAMLGELSYGIIHDMASPIAILQIGSGSLAENKHTREEIAESVELINKATERLVVFQNLLRKTVRSGGKMDATQVDGQQVMKDLSALFLTSCRQKEIEFETNIQEIGPTPLFCREDYLQRCLSNAIQNSVNALKTSGHKRISLKLTVNAGNAIFEVSDTGPGIPDSVVQKSLKGMTQSENSTGDVAGSGYGLYAMRKMAEQMQGRLDIESKPGQGTVMRFVIPLDYRTQKVSA